MGEEYPALIDFLVAMTEHLRHYLGPQFTMEENSQYQAVHQIVSSLRGRERWVLAFSSLSAFHGNPSYRWYQLSE